MEDCTLMDRDSLSSWLCSVENSKSIDRYSANHCPPLQVSSEQGTGWLALLHFLDLYFLPLS